MSSRPVAVVHCAYVVMARQFAPTALRKENLALMCPADEEVHVIVLVGSIKVAPFVVEQ